MESLSVRFYQREMKKEFESAVQGRPIHHMVDFVEIKTPGDRLNIIDTIANQDHKDRFPMEWMRFLNEGLEGKHQSHVGTLLTDWPLLSSAQASELKHYNFFTVEQVAEGSDQQLGNIGLLAGMSPLSLRDKAKAFLNVAKDSAAAMAQVDELAKRDAQIAALTEQMKELMASKPKPGRPPKQTVEA